VRTLPRARRRFAQHFLVEPDVARRIVALAGIEEGESVLEIGPGRGALTGLLAERAARLVLVEIDRDLASRLREDFAGRPNVEVVEADILDLDLRALLGDGGRGVVVANLPYNISTPALARLLDACDLFRRLVLMLQREVALRLGAVPGTKVYGALSVMIQLVARPRIAFSVPPAVFRPRPKVDSAVVVVDPLAPPPLGEAERRAVRRVVRAAFAQRRKQLGNALEPLTHDCRTLLERLGIDPRRRAETLTPAEFLSLARAIERRGTADA
jgi:16S rRNA (adenine1518-N6/adenine1519-N6)-dimethyltransferase